MVSFIEGNKIENEPNLLFDKSDSSAVSPQVYWGLRRFGPFDKSAGEIRIGVIAPASSMDRVKSLLNELENGVPIFPGGMQQFFRCNLAVAQECIVSGNTADDYENAGVDFVSVADQREVDVVLVFIPKTGRYFSNTPYYRLKAVLATHGFASQMITDMTFSNLKWSYLNLASAIFAKAGHIPWVLESEMPNTGVIFGNFPL